MVIVKLPVSTYGDIPTDVTIGAVMVLHHRMLPAVDPSDRKKYPRVPQSEEVTVPNVICPLPLDFAP